MTSLARSNHPWLENLSPASRNEILSHSTEIRLSKGEVLWRTGEPSKGVFLVVEGSIRILRGAKGRQVVIHTSHSGSTIGEVPSIDGGGYPALAVVAEPTRVLRIGTDTFRKVVRRDPDLAWFLLERLSHRIRHVVERLSAATLETLRTRLAAHLLAQLTLSTTDTVSLATTQANLAEEFGTVREVLARELRFLKSEGIIASAGTGRYRVTNERELERIAAGSDA
jgi:CRP-like cAMP-binding protein